MQEENKDIEKELEEILIEGDKIGERLGSDVRKRMIDISNAGVKYVTGAWALGSLATATLGYASGLFEYLPKGYDLSDALLAPFLSVAVGGPIGVIPAMWIVNKLEDRKYSKLERKFPEKAEDIEKCRGLANTYHSSLAIHRAIR